MNETNYVNVNKNMSCLYQNCTNGIRAICLVCQTNQYLCRPHYQKHRNEIGHPIQKLSRKSLKNLIKIHLSPKIENCISIITAHSVEIISAVTTASKQAISLLKSISESLKNIHDFIPITLDPARTGFIVSQVSLLIQEMKESPLSTINKLLEEVNSFKNSLEVTTGENCHLKQRIAELEQLNKSISLEKTEQAARIAEYEREQNFKFEEESKDLNFDKDSLGQKTQESIRSNYEIKKKDRALTFSPVTNLSSSQHILKRCFEISGEFYLEMNGCSKDQKFKYLKENFGFLESEKKLFQELLISNDNNFAFYCSF